jgi:hypothetical protein
MATLTSSSTVAIGSGSAVVESVTVPILAAIGGATGQGRLIHPTLGTLDYAQAPDEWRNVDADVIVAPVWSNSKTLLGSANALWPGNLRDVEVEERWTQPLAMEAAFVRQLLTFFQTPPDPDTDAPVQWWPNYASTLGFEVAIKDVAIGDGGTGAGVVLTPLLNAKGWVEGKVVITMQVLGRAS